MVYLTSLHTTSSPRPSFPLHICIKDWKPYCTISRVWYTIPYLNTIVVMVNQMQESIQAHRVVLPHPFMILPCDFTATWWVTLSFDPCRHQPGVVFSDQVAIQLAHCTDRGI